MSRVGKLPIKVPTSITVKLNGKVISFDNNKVKKDYRLSDLTNCKLDQNTLTLTCDKSNSDASMYLGMERSNLSNIVKGLSEGFKKTLEINGVGYKASLNKNVLVLTLGYSHEIYYILPENISASVEKNTTLHLESSDNILLGQVATEIKSFRKPEPYKGKGVKLKGEKIVRKEGKKK